MKKKKSCSFLSVIRLQKKLVAIPQDLKSYFGIPLPDLVFKLRL